MCADIVTIVLSKDRGQKMTKRQLEKVLMREHKIPLNTRFFKVMTGVLTYRQLIHLKRKAERQKGGLI